MIFFALFLACLSSNNNPLLAKISNCSSYVLKTFSLIMKPLPNKKTGARRSPEYVPNYYMRKYERYLQRTLYYHFGSMLVNSFFLFTSFYLNDIPTTSSDYGNKHNYFIFELLQNLQWFKPSRSLRRDDMEQIHFTDISKMGGFNAQTNLPALANHISKIP